jgi:hypothetical protein
VALEVHIFAEDLRGVGEGHYPWDLIKDPNIVTNATVAGINEVNPAERQLRLTYKEGAKAPARASRPSWCRTSWTPCSS